VRLTDVLTLDLIGLLASFTFLGCSSWSDIVSREVPDRVWLVSYPVGIVLIAVRLIVETSSWMLILISVASAVALSVVLPYLGLWGGADGKAFICLALMNPMIPALGESFSHIVNPFFPLVVFSNAYIASLASMLYPIQRNLRALPTHELFEGLEDERFLRKVAAFLTGYRVQVRELESKPFLFLLESVDHQGSTPRRHFIFDLRVDSDRRKELADIKAAVDSGLLRGTVWASPGLPFLLFVTVGLGLSVLFGDIVWRALSALVHYVGTLA
jgi:preflagellin peptidase FlaK